MTTFIPKINPPEFGDEKAVNEADALASGYDLKKQAEFNEYGRKEHLKNHVAKGMVFLFWLVVFLGVIAIISWAWHFLAPVNWHYLSEGQLEKIETVLFTGALASVLQAYARKYF